MNILILNYEYPPIGGGGGVISQHVANGLSKHHKVTVLSTWFPGLTEEEDHPNLRIIRVKSRRRSEFRSNPLEMLSWIRHSKRALDNLCKSRQFDICFANFVLPGGEVALYLKRKYNIPYVLLSHGHDIPWAKPYGALVPLHLMSYFRLKTICRASDRIFVQTNMIKSNADMFVGVGWANRVKVISNGCEASVLSGQNKSKSNLNIVFVGRLVHQKAPMVFLKAIEIFAQYQRDFTVSIYGDGPLRRRMERFVAESGLTDHITFYGKVTQNKVLESYSRAHIMVAPSLSEGMSISMLEALSRGVYLIATRVSGVEDMLESKLNGELVPFKDPFAIVESLRAYCSQKLPHAYTVPETYLKEFQKKFAWKRIVQEYDSELKEAVELRNGKIRVLHVIDTLDLGGAQTLLKSILSSGDQRLHQRAIALRRTKLCVLEKEENVTVCSSGWRLSISPLFALRKEVVKHNITLLHCHLPRSIVFGYIIKRLVRPKIKLVLHEHGDIYEEGWILPLLLKYFQSKTDKFIACSEAVRAKLIDRAGIKPRRIEVLRNCWETSHIAPACDLASTVKRRGPFIVGFAGRLVHRKGWLDFLKLASQLVKKQKGVRVIFRIAGSGPDSERLSKAIEELGLDNDVSVLGYVEDMATFYGNIDCCVIPSAWEGLALVQLEAMASGVPVITYNAPGLNEIAGMNEDALVVPQGNVQALADEVIGLIEDERLFRKLQVAGLQTVEKYNSETYNASLFSLYGHLA